MVKPIEGWPNGLICYTEADIRAREYLIQTISHHMRDWMRKLNPQIEFERVETPCMIPLAVAQAHVNANFPLWHASGGPVEQIEDYDDEHFWLRPESTAGTYLMFDVLFPQDKQFRKRLPFCLWQAGLSFRREQDKTFSNLRFKQFYQLEFQLAYAEGTKADYHEHAVEGIMELMEFLFPLWNQLGLLGGNGLWAIKVGEERAHDQPQIEKLPFYSSQTTDIYIGSREVVAISTRTDFKVPVLEISCGLDRLTALHQRCVDGPDLHRDLS